MSLQPTAKGDAARGCLAGSSANKEATDADVALLLVLHQSLLNINEGMNSAQNVTLSELAEEVRLLRKIWSRIGEPIGQDEGDRNQDEGGSKGRTWELLNWLIRPL